tara:strand:+ start:2694 stop:3389 length:696 start_codon:yes stop_codon:yes gene_type:complete
MSYANGLSPFRGKVKQFIIPVSRFKRPKQVTAQKDNVVKGHPAKFIPKNENSSHKTKPSAENTKPFYPPSIKIEKVGLGNRVSSLSLSSIEMKKEAERKSSSKKISINKAEDKFSQEKVSELWKSYTKEKNNMGQNNIAALLEMSQPQLQADHKIILKTSSSLSKVELKKELTSLRAYLNKSLNNYKIHFEIKVESHKSEKYIYGAKEKYEHLKQINPEIEVLKKEFDLDI